ncbi:hypothetical protein ABZT26_25860 [Streptomyces sp. NPDC005395]|uniref:hypothetical protein n=1 Tax=Streptomyces sp. NPDC005395 TaxID=3157042 RepID=UPI0033B70D4B
MDLAELHVRSYTYDPESLRSLIEAARDLSLDYRRDHALYTGGSMSESAVELGRKVSAEYGLKALDIVNDLAQAPAPIAPSGMPSAEVAADYLHAVAGVLLQTRENAVRALYNSPFEMPMQACELLFDWLVLGGYVWEVRVNTVTGQVDGVRCGGKPTEYERKLMSEPRWIGSHCGVWQREPVSPLRNKRELYLHPGVAASYFVA